MFSKNKYLIINILYKYIIFIKVAIIIVFFIFKSPCLQKIFYLCFVHFQDSLISKTKQEKNDKLYFLIHEHITSIYPPVDRLPAHPAPGLFSYASSASKRRTAPAHRRSDTRFARPAHRLPLPLRTKKGARNTTAQTKPEETAVAGRTIPGSRIPGRRLSGIQHRLSNGICKTSDSSGRPGEKSRHAGTSMYKEADELLNKIKRSSLPHYIIPYYYHLKRTLYGLLADYALEPEIRNDYNRHLNLYRDSILQSNPTNSFTYYVVKADELTAQHNYASALQILREALYRGQLNSHDRGIIYYGMAEVFAQTQQSDSTKIYYALSAQCDLKAAVREYVSLHRLAELLFNEGDIERAYNYIKCSVEDARACNARVRSLEFMPVFTIIEEVYQAQIQKQRELSITFTYITCAFCVILLITFVILFFQNHKLNSVKEKLNQTNQHLQTVNDSLTESNHVKEEYLSRYMDQCAVYIDKMDEYRRSLNKLASMGKMEELSKNLKSQNSINNERKMFYAEFDQSFLKLYPDFVEKFNKLLVPEARITPKPNALTPELRIYALVRLGTTDSTQIARFLCYSVTTIYNYRVKIRNSAICSRDDFEEQVKLL